jgi:hypothetical protein
MQFNRLILLRLWDKVVVRNQKVTTEKHSNTHTQNTHTHTHFFIDISLILSYNIRNCLCTACFGKAKFYILMLLAGWK